MLRDVRGYNDTIEVAAPNDSLKRREHGRARSNAPKSKGVVAVRVVPGKKRYAQKLGTSETEECACAEFLIKIIQAV